MHQTPKNKKIDLMIIYYNFKLNIEKQCIMMHILITNPNIVNSGHLSTHAAARANRIAVLRAKRHREFKANIRQSVQATGFNTTTNIVVLVTIL